MKLVYIKWFDAHYDNGTMSTEQVKKQPEYIMESVGIYVSEDKKYVNFANEWYFEGKTWRYSHCIPKVNIIKKRIIKI